MRYKKSRGNVREVEGRAGDCVRVLSINYFLFFFACGEFMRFVIFSCRGRPAWRTLGCAGVSVLCWWDYSEQRTMIGTSLSTGRSTTTLTHQILDRRFISHPTNTLMCILVTWSSRWGRTMSSLQKVYNIVGGFSVQWRMCRLRRGLYKSVWKDQLGAGGSRCEEDNQSVCWIEGQGCTPYIPCVGRERVYYK